MSRAKKFNESFVSDSPKRVQNLSQYAVGGNMRKPTQSTQPVLEAGVYKISTDFQGNSFFEVYDINTDELLKFQDSRYNSILKEVEDFWDLKPRFEDMGFTNKRGILLHGAPGTGKSCLLKLMMEDMVKRGNVVFLGGCSCSAIRSALHEFREIEPDRKALVIVEELDEMLYDLRTLTDLLDGDSQVGDVIFLATTNYLDRIPPKLTREGRLDRKVEVFPPPLEGRYEYLKHKLSKHLEDSVIKKYSEDTDGFTFGQLREFLVGTYCYNKPYEQVIKVIRNGGGLSEKRVVGESELEKLLLQRFGYKLNEGKMTEHDSFKALPDFGNMESIDPKTVTRCMNKRLKDLGIAGVRVTEVEVTPEGAIMVLFSGNGSEELAVLFVWDEKGGSLAMTLPEEVPEEGEVEVNVVDLNPLHPSLLDAPLGKSLNLGSLEWLDKSTLLTILGVEIAPHTPTVTTLDAYGHTIVTPHEGFRPRRRRELCEKRTLNSVQSFGVRSAAKLLKEGYRPSSGLVTTSGKYSLKRRYGSSKCSESFKVPKVGEEVTFLRNNFRMKGQKARVTRVEAAPDPEDVLVHVTVGNDKITVGLEELQGYNDAVS